MSPIEGLVLDYQTTRRDSNFNAIFRRMRKAIEGIASTRVVQRTFDFDDAVQEGSVALLRAVENWDPSFAVPFIPFARIYIRRAIDKASKREMSECGLTSTTWLREDGNEYFELATTWSPELSLIEDSLRCIRESSLLNDRDAEILRLYYEQGWTYERIGRGFGVSKQRIEQRLIIIHEYLRNRLE